MLVGDRKFLINIKTKNINTGMSISSATDPQNLQKLTNTHTDTHTPSRNNKTGETDEHPVAENRASG